MFNSLLRALIQTYLAQSIAVWASFLQTDLDTKKGLTDLSIAIVLGVYLLAFPIWICVFLKRRSETISRPETRQKYDSVYQNVDVYKPAALKHTSFFLWRRLIFAMVLICCQVSIVLQVILADVMSTLLLTFFITVKPMVDGINNVT